MNFRSIFGLFWLTVGFPMLLSAQSVSFNQQPDWESQPLGHYSTGLGIADINGDGWEDLIVANGNDMARQRLVVYYNQGDGSFPLTPDWQSSDVDYLGHLSVGDINGDSRPDVAVSVFLGPAGFSEPGLVKVYFNTGSELQSLPGFKTADRMYTFSCALGDADGDGDLDLAVAAGEPYNNVKDNGRIYFNQNGVLDSLPGWKTQQKLGAMDVGFADFDGNGQLDIAFASHLTANSIYLADSSGDIANIAAWHSADPSYYANSLCVGFVGPDSLPDLLISDNSQLGGAGKFKGYFFTGSVPPQSQPDWTSLDGGMGSSVWLEDVNGDSYPDFIGGRWWGAVKVYPGTASGISSASVWQSATASVCEAFAMKDLDRDGVTVHTVGLRPSLHGSSCLRISARPVEKILSLTKNGVPLTAGQDFVLNPDGFWVSFKADLQTGDSLIVEYELSADRDLVLTNWGPSEGNYIFYNQTQLVSLPQTEPLLQAFSLRAFPNPFNSSVQIEIRLATPQDLVVDIYNSLGQRVRRLWNRPQKSAGIRLSWNATDDAGNPLPSGIYFVTAKTAAGKTYSSKIILAK